MIRLTFGLGVALALGGCALSAQAQPADEAAGAYEPSAGHPFGRLNPEAPPETAQYAFMIGAFDCDFSFKEFRKGEWVPAGEGRATWNARYILNGHAILDEFSDGSGAIGNVRVFDAEAGHWLIQYTRANPAEAVVHRARQIDGNMVMVSERSSNGYSYTERVTFQPRMPGVYRWTQEVVYTPETAVTIYELICRRR